MKLFLRYFLLSLASLTLLNGCIFLDVKMVSDEQLTHKAAMALNVPDNEVTLSERTLKSGQAGNTLHFTATTKAGSTHRCYIVVGFFGLLDPIATCAGLQK